MDRESVKELIQNELTTKNLKKELAKIVAGEQRSKILKDYDILEQKLGGQGASEKTATLIIENV